MKPNNGNPTVGRIVHFVPKMECTAETTLPHYAAIVAQVNPDETLDLATFGPNSLYFQHKVPYSEILHPGHWSWPVKASV